MPGVIRQRAHALPFEPLGGFLDLAARQAIDDAGVGRPSVVRVLGADEIEQLRARVVLLDDAIADVRPVEARNEHARVVEREAMDDFVARDGVGGGRERDARHRRESARAAPTAECIQAGNRAPIATRNALRRWRTARSRARSSRSRKRGVIRRSGATYSRSSSPSRSARSVAAASAPDSVEFRYAARTPTSRQRGDLILHQRDQRRHDDARAEARLAPHERRNLVAQRLAAARRHQHERIAARRRRARRSRACCPRKAG